LITQAEKAAEFPVIITSNADLATAGKTWQTAKILAIDTEFIRERTYYAILGLIQVSDGNTVWLVDPLEVTDFQPLVDMLINPSTLKLLHAPSEDLEVLQNSINCMPEPMFDMQLAASALGQPLQISYQKLIEWQLDILIDKGESRSKWLQRPLTDSQLHYAAMDVCYLPMVYQQVTAELEKLGRYEWVIQDSQLQLDKARQSLDPDQLYFRFRNAWRLKPARQKIIQALCIWREEEAEKRDLPRTFVLRDNDLMAITVALPDSFTALKECTDAHPRALQRYSGKILELINEVKAQPDAEASGKLPPPPLDGREKQCLNAVRETIAEISAGLNIESTILASRRELEYLILNRPVLEAPARFLGWRKQYLNEAFQSTIRGCRCAPGNRNILTGYQYRLC